MTTDDAATMRVQIGHSKQMQYLPGAKRHAVEQDSTGSWLLRCTQKAATREYTGFVRALECKRCIKLVTS